MPLKLEDFKYWQGRVNEDKAKHDTELSTVNSPQETIDAYNGIFDDHDVGQHTHSQQMIENWLFIFIATALPSLFFQLPRMLVRAKRDSLNFEAAILNSYINNTFNEKDKEENQLAIIDALLPYGFGVIKNGYNSRTGRKQSITDKAKGLLTGKTGEVNPNDMEATNEFIQFEKIIGIRHSPKEVYLDSSQPFGKGNRVTFVYKRTLQQLIDSNIYNLSTNFIERYAGRAKDKREVDLELTELFVMLNGFAHKIAYIDGWPEELAFVKTKYDSLPVSLLRFNKIGDVLYCIAHGTLGLNAQKELNYLNELWKKHLDNLRNQHLVDATALDESGRKTLRQNDIGGIVYANKPVTSGTAAPLQSAQMDANLFSNISNVRDYLKTLLSVTGGRGGGTDTSKFATTERQRAVGDVLRSSGLQDAIRDFLVDQIKQRIKNVLRLANPQMMLKITGDNVFDPKTGQRVAPGTEVQIGGQGGFELKQLITGDIDVDYIFEVDIVSAAKPDFPVIRKQLVEAITTAQALKMDLAVEGKKLNASGAVEKLFETFDAIPDAKALITDLSEEEKAKMDALVQATQAAEGGTPTPEGVSQGAETVLTGAEGL